MGNQVSDSQQPQYQRMGTEQQSRRQQPQYRRVQSAQTAKQQEIGIENAIDTLQSMFMLMDREVLRLVLMEQCQGNLDNAVETLLTMQATSNINQSGGTQVMASSIKSASTSSSSSSKGSTASSTAASSSDPQLYDDNMRPLTVSDSFLQPPSYYLSKYYGLNSLQISSLQIQQQRESENEAISEISSPKKDLSNIAIDASIIGQWTNLMKKYKFKSQNEMDKLCKMECKSLNRCGSLVRVIFMMKLYNRLCNESGYKMNEECGELMHAYLSQRGFKEYSLIQLINDCNHLMQYHQFGGDHLKSMIDIKERNKMELMMREYFGHCDVMKCRIIQRILQRQDNDDNKNKMSEIDVERDIVDKYHRVFFHPLN